MPHKALVDTAKSVLVIVDVQEAFRSAIGDFALIASNIATAARGLQILDVPVVVTEQYPKGLGRTAEEILLTLPDGFEPVEKTAFSAMGSAAFRKRLSEIGAWANNSLWSRNARVRESDRSRSYRTRLERASFDRLCRVAVRAR